MITLLVAMDEDRVIGNGNELPWHLPEDLKLFKQRTIGHTVIMGRKTWESLPVSHLPGRVNMVITRQPDKYAKTVENFDPVEGPHFITTFELAVSTARREFPEYTEEIFLIGGEQLYDLALRRNLCERMIISHVDGKHMGDRYFPRFGPIWKVGDTEEHNGFHVTEYTRA